MPRADSDKKRAKPYDSEVKQEPSESDSKPKLEAKRARPWETEEYILLLEHVVASKRGAKAFEGVVPGRTGNQAWLAWR